MYCYFNGQFIDESKVSISIHNLGLQRGFGIFDLFRERNSIPIFFEDHLERFDRSQEFLDLDHHISKDEIREAVVMLQKMNGCKESTFRLMLLGDGNDSNAVLKPLFYILNEDMNGFQNPDTANLILHEHLREYPMIKSINYMTSYHLHRARKQAKAIDVLYHNKGVLTEASRSNVFAVIDGVLFTPADNILPGVTRKNVLSIVNGMMPVKVQDLTLDMLAQADEVFITSTIKEVLPIIEIDKKRVGEGQIGAFTKQIQEAFADLLL